MGGLEVFPEIAGLDFPGRELGGVPAVTHLLFVAAIRLIGVPAPSDGSSRAPTSPFTTPRQSRFHPGQSTNPSGSRHHSSAVQLTGLVSALPQRLSPYVSVTLCFSAVWMEFPQDHDSSCSRPPARPLEQLLRWLEDKIIDSRKQGELCRRRFNRV